MMLYCYGYNCEMTYYLSYMCFVLLWLHAHIIHSYISIKDMFWRRLQYSPPSHEKVLTWDEILLDLFYLFDKLRPVCYFFASKYYYCKEACFAETLVTC